MRKRSLIDTENEVNDFHHRTAVPFLKVLIKEIRDIFNLDNLPYLLAMMALDLHDIPSKEDDSFDSHRNDKIETLFNFYSKTQDDVFDGHGTSSPTLLLCTQKSLKMEYDGYKSYVAQLKIGFKQKLVSEVSKIKTSILQTSAKKYKSCHAVTEREQELSNIKKKMEDPVKVEDVLKDNIIETVFPDIQRLLRIYICMPQSEAIVEDGFLKMNLILTKKQTALDNDTLDALMRLSHWKTKLNTYKTQEIVGTLKHKKDWRIFSSEL